MLWLNWDAVVMHGFTGSYTCTSSEGFEIGICKDESHPGKDLAVEKLQFCSYVVNC